MCWLALAAALEVCKPVSYKTLMLVILTAAVGLASPVLVD